MGSRLWVTKDAAYRDGLAGLGVAGSLGTYSKLVGATSSGHAETLALLWAMDLATDFDEVDFVTDYYPISLGYPVALGQEISDRLADHPGWKILPVRRSKTHEPHKLAQRELRAWFRKAAVARNRTFRSRSGAHLFAVDGQDRYGWANEVWRVGPPSEGSVSLK